MIQQKMIRALLEALMEAVMTIHKIGPFQAGQQRLPMNEGDCGPEVQDERTHGPFKNFHNTIKTTFLCQPFLQKKKGIPSTSKDT